MMNMNVPDDILPSIFFRLPTKPLFRFKSVSKHWNRVISDPRFIKSRSRRMILLPVQPFHSIDKTDYTMVKLGFPFGNPESNDIILVGSFNGVVFLVINDMMILCNPLTGAFKRVPDPPLRIPNRRYKDTYGFGYGNGVTPNGLKIVRLRVSGRITFCDVFDVENGTWITPSNLAGCYVYRVSTGTLVNGIIYWIARRKMQRISMVTFDVTKMILSASQFIFHFSRGTLGTLNGQLCLICCHDHTLGLELLVKPENETSWVVICLLSLSLNVFKVIYEPLCILDEGKMVMLLKKQNQVIIYEMMKDSYTVVNGLNSLGEIPYTTQAIEYVESLVSPSDICSSLI